MSKFNAAAAEKNIAVNDEIAGIYIHPLRGGGGVKRYSWRNVEEYLYEKNKFGLVTFFI